MNKKNNTFIAVLISLVGISVIVAIFVFSLSKTAPDDGYFNQKKKGAAKQLYTELMSLTEDSDFKLTEPVTGDDGEEIKVTRYPQAPKDVVAFYLKGTRLLYGDMIKDESIIPEILRKQRIMYSKELMEKNTLENQEKQVKIDMINLETNNTCVVECAVGSEIFYDNNMNNAYVCVTLESDAGEKSYWKYYMKRDDNGFWRIDNIQGTNESFTE